MPHLIYVCTDFNFSTKKVDVSFVNAHNMDTNGMENEDSRDKTENVKRFPRKIFNILDTSLSFVCTTKFLAIKVKS